jgi:hypothetical protein
MKITAIVATGFLACISVQAGQAGEKAARKVTVCTERFSDIPMVRERAQQLATQIFAEAGVAIDWRALHSCPNHALKIIFSATTPEDRSPGELAYAQPFEGIHIEIFYDRVRTRGVAPDRLLAHVLVHEITHMLQRTDQHAERGIMSARWTSKDFLTMGVTTLPFTPTDLKLIQLGLAARDRSSHPAQSVVDSGAARPADNQLVLPS